MSRNRAKSHKKYQQLIILCLIAGLSVISITCYRCSVPPNSARLKVATPYFYDDTPPGSYDFTLYSPNPYNDYVSVPAPCSGHIGETGYEKGGYGHYLTLLCGHENWFMAHFDSVSVSIGSSITKGNYIARQGSSGNATGPHIHAEILHSNGQRIENRSRTESIVRKYLSYVES